MLFYIFLYFLKCVHYCCRSLQSTHVTAIVRSIDDVSDKLRTSGATRGSWKMSTIPYVNTTRKATPTYPLVMFARSRNKNTADLTSSELRQFLKWLWAVEPIKKKLCVLPDVGKGRYWQRTPHKRSQSCKS
jgi:hypothetical protein